MKEPSQFSSVDSERWQTLAGVIRYVFPEAIVAPFTLAGRTDSRFFEGTAGDVYRFSPVVLSADGMGGFHGTDEFVRIGDAQRAVTFFARLIDVAARTDAHFVAPRSGQDATAKPLVLTTCPRAACESIQESRDLERETGLEPATFCLGSRYSTN